MDLSGDIIPQVDSSILEKYIFLFYLLNDFLDTYVHICFATTEI